jgi:hypothetical protein
LAVLGGDVPNAAVLHQKLAHLVQVTTALLQYRRHLLPALTYLAVFSGEGTALADHIQEKGIIKMGRCGGSIRVGGHLVAGIVERRGRSRWRVSEASTGEAM